MKDVNLLKQNGVDVDKSLELFGDIETYDDTLVDFLEEAADRLNKTKMYKEANDMPNYAIFAHSLKSGARYLGMNTLADMAYQHEMESKAGNQAFVNNNYDALVAETNKMVSLVKRYLGEESSSLEPLVTPSPQAQMPTQPTQVTQQNPAPITGAKTILVVDDSNLVLNFIQKAFAGQYEVVEAKDGQIALDIIASSKEGEIAGMLLDLNMPNVDGFTVLEHFKINNLFDKIPVSIISGHDSKETVETAFKYPIKDMLNKPFSESDVKRIVEKTINKA